MKLLRFIGKTIRAVAFALFTVLLIGILCGGICGLAGIWYIREYVEPNTYIDVSAIGINFTSIIYAKNPETGEYYEYDTLSGDENRIWVDLDQIPQDLQKAVVAIEDQRFYQHRGVDWLRTAKGVLNWVSGDTGGGSTITQQLIKNLIGENEYSIQRKIYEIFRALRLEQTLDGDKGRILEMYLNTIYLGNRCYGVSTAAETYFGKEVSELDLAECAALAGITNNPSKYDPFRHPENVRSRQVIILEQMRDQGLITESQYSSAYAEELDYRKDVIEKNAEPNSWFTDTIIRDLIKDLQNEYGYEQEIAKNIVYSGGLQIYATIDVNIQKIMDEVYANNSNFPNASKNGTLPQSAMVVCDKQGSIMGLVGARGEKNSSLDLNRATQSYRQPGSSIKPISVYGLAMDNGDITPYSVITDMPVYVDEDNNPRPKNDDRTYHGQTVVQDAVARSVNAVAMQIMKTTTPEVAYEFLTETLGFAKLELADCNLAPLSLGGMTKGVTAREMAGAYTLFLNDGKYSGTRTYTKVLDHDGNVLINKEPTDTQVFKREQTSVYMTQVLEGVTDHGTGRKATIPGIATAGKTGTTNSNRDRWFCGYTPYYVGATWFGYDEDYNLTGISGNPALNLWTTVMRRIHEDLPNAEFTYGDDADYVECSYCTESGMKPTSYCEAMGDVAVGRFHVGDEPVEECNVHKPVTICAESGRLWSSSNCPIYTQAGSIRLDITRYFPVYVSIEDSYKCFTGDNPPIGEGDVMVSGGYLGYCGMDHSVAPTDPEQEGEPGTEPDDGATGTDEPAPSQPSGGDDPE